MTHQAAGFRRVIPWLYAVLLITAMLAAVVFWLRASFERRWNVPHAIYATAQLADAYHVYRRDRGDWPAPGAFAAKEVAYVRTFNRGNMRYDVFNFGGGQYVYLELHGNGTLLALAVRGDEPPSSAR